ncbi:MAG: tetratricopeptide repeat protein, partial [Verrucomicrobiaceae bacterium]
MKCRSLALFTLILIGGAFGASAESPILAEARKALREDLPQIAAHKLRTALIASELMGEERSAGIRLLAEALISSGQHEEALKRLERNETGHPEAALLKGRALAALGRWDEALPVFEAVVSGS